MTLPDWMTPAPTPTRPTRSTPTPVPTRMTDARARLGLTPTRMAQYLGVPVFTYLKWERGQRAPNASALRLLDVLEMVEAHAPKLHAQLLEGGK